MPATLVVEEITYTFITLSGQAQIPRLQLEPITRPGVDGVAVRQISEISEPFEMIGIVDQDDLPTAVIMAETLQGLQGKVGQLTADDYGTNQGNVIIMEAKRMDIKPVVGASGGLSSGKGALLYMRFVFQAFF